MEFIQSDFSVSKNSENSTLNDLCEPYFLLEVNYFHGFSITNYAYLRVGQILPPLRQIAPRFSRGGSMILIGERLQVIGAHFSAPEGASV